MPVPKDHNIEQLTSHLTFNRAIATISSRFVAPENIDKAVQDSLADLGDLCGASRVYLFRFDDEFNQMSNIYEWCANGVSPQKDNLQDVPTQDFPWWMSRLKNGEIIHITDVSTLPPEAQGTKSMLDSQDIKSLLAFPLKFKEDLAGFVGFDNVEKTGSWKEQDFLMLNLTSHILGQVMGRLQEEKRLRKSESELRLVLDSVREGVTLSDAQGYFYVFNSEMEQITGYTKTQANESQDFHAQLHPGEVSGEAIGELNQFEDGNKTETEARITTAAGDNRDLLVTTTAVNYLDQKMFLSTYKDISERKKFENELKDREQKFRRLFEQSNDAIIIHTFEGDILDINQVTTEMFGYSREELLSMKIPQLHPEEFLAQAGEQMKNVTQQNGIRFESQFMRKDGHRFDVDISARVISQEEGLVQGVIRDISERKQILQRLEAMVQEKTSELEEKVHEVEDLARFPAENPNPIVRISVDNQLLYANGAAKDIFSGKGCPDGSCLIQEWQPIIAEVSKKGVFEKHDFEIGPSIFMFDFVPEVDRGYVNVYGRNVTKERAVDKMKSDFVSLASHQLRTPLTALRWTSDKMLHKYRDGLNDKQLKTAKTFYETTVHLVRLVNDLLSISRIESGTLVIQPQKGNWCEVVTSVVEELNPLAEDKKVTLILDCVDMAEGYFDQDLVRQIYVNLISNAIKYTPEGGQVGVGVREETSSTGRQIVSEVRDTGIGIPEEKHDQVFQRFFRAQNAIDTDEEGTGLGLHLVKLIVEQTGGQIWFESYPGEGTIFNFTLPLADTPEDSNL